MFTRHNFKRILRKLELAAASLALLGAMGSVGRAEITNAVAYGYSSALYCYATFDDANDVLRMAMTQNAAGQLGGYIYTDSPTDPTLTLLHVIDNATGIAWSSYHVSFFMPNLFSIGNAMVNIPAGWSSVVTAPVPVTGGYLGQVDFTGGPLVLPAATLNFQFDITFADGLLFSFTETAIPGLVPEPSTLSLVLMGLIGCGLRKFRKAA
jgi:hypothetical protein